MLILKGLRQKVVDSNKKRQQDAGAIEAQPHNYSLTTIPERQRSVKAKVGRKGNGFGHELGQGPKRNARSD
jgi:hypothetical protein